MTHPLDNPLWAALSGPQAHLAVRLGRAARFPPDVSPFAAVAGDGGWADLAALVGEDGTAVVPDAPEVAPHGWELVGAIPGVQMDGTRLEGGADPEAVALGPADVPEMLDLIERTQPGPFLPRTITLGTYLGIRRDGALVAMAGERMRVEGYGEVSGVCVDPSVRGEGLGAVVTLAAAHGIQERGDRAMLHVRDGNDGAHRLYRRVGFEQRRTVAVVVLRPEW